MILLVSGEGPSDIGSTVSDISPTQSVNVNWGAMGRIIDKIVEPIWGYGPIDTGGMLFISEPKLIGIQKAHKRAHRLAIALPGREKGQGTSFYFANARTLARMAKEIQQKEKQPVGAVLFRDSDGTRSSAPTDRAANVQSMERGFGAETFSFGVAMVPKPKSEAWLLCALQENPYLNCERLEEISGNDVSPNSAKQLLYRARDKRPDRSKDATELIMDGTVDTSRIDMPSFNEFKHRLTEVATAMLASP